MTYFLKGNNTGQGPTNGNGNGQTDKSWDKQIDDRPIHLLCPINIIQMTQKIGRKNVEKVLWELFLQTYNC